MVEWRQVVGYEGLYEVSAEGSVRSLTPSKNRHDLPYELSQATKRSGYRYVKLWLPGSGGKKHYVHHLVAAAFLGPRPTGEYALHNDGARSHNAALNLRYGTPSENIQDAFGHGSWPVGSRHPLAKLDEEVVRSARRAHKRGQNLARLARKLGVSDSTLRDAVSGKTWKHIAP